MQLILHIGMPKTGSTALQNALTAMSPALRERGVLFPTPKTGFNNHNFLWLLTGNAEHLTGMFRYKVQQNPNYLTQTIPAAWASILSDVQRYKPRKLILSSEMLFYALSLDDRGLLRDKLNSLSDDVVTFAYFRQPSRHYLSVTQQYLKDAANFSPPAPLRVRHCIEDWERSMGNSMIALRYDRAALCDGDITTDFLSRCLEPEDYAGIDIPHISANETLSAESMEIIQDYRRALYPDDDDERFEDGIALRRALTEVETSVVRAGKPELHPEIAEYIDYSSTELLWLRERYGLAFPNLDYARIADRPALKLPESLRVSDICLLDPHKKDVLHAHAIKRIHDKLAHRLEKYKRKRRSLLGLFR